jgi:hypothetical protein
MKSTMRIGTRWTDSTQIPGTKVRNGVTEAFEIASHRWRHVPKVLDELAAVCEIIKDSLEIALDISRPSNVNTHIPDVINNIMSMFDRRWDPRLERVMLDYAESAIKIQSVWRKCISDPSHPACRRRLLREFNDLETLRS